MKITTDNCGNPVLEQFSVDGFIDCAFRICDLIESPEYFNFHISASSEGKVLGMDVAVRKDIKGGFDKQMTLVKEHVCREGVIFFIRSGTESDRLIAPIACLYGLPHNGAEMVRKESFTAISLHQGECDLWKQPLKIKLFGRDAEPFDESAYYESFFNIDLANGFVYWNEKDQEYRKPLICGLTKPSEQSGAE